MRLGQMPITIGPGGVTMPQPGAPTRAAEFFAEPADYVLDKVLTANQEALGQATQIDADSDFVLMAICGFSTSTYNLRIQGPNRRYLQSAYVRNTNLVGSANFPVAFLAELYYPAGSTISVDLKDTSGSGNTIQLMFRGFRRYRLA